VNRARAVAVAALLLASACGVQEDAAPRDVPEDNRARLSGVSIGGDASGAERIYLIGPGDDRLLRSVPRDQSTPEGLIDVLLLGPNAQERDDQYSSAIPDGVEVVSIEPQGSRLVIDVSEELTTLSGPPLVQALAQIVYTASEIDGVESVQITVEQEQVSWPTADLDATDAPLRVYDYPGLVLSAQPAYPSVPAGG
jgi:Sporulation and spore germination